MGMACRWICAGMLAWLLAGCTLGPDFARPEAPATDRYTAQGDGQATPAVQGEAQQFEAGAAPTARWWQLFGSTALDTLVTQGLQHNQGLVAAEASLRQSQSALRAGYGVFYPQLSAGVGASREKFSPALFGSNTPGPTFNLFTLSASVSYALDIFGGQRRLVEGLAAETDLQQALRQGYALTLSGNLVNTAIARAAYLSQQADTQALIAVQRAQLGLAEHQVAAGTVPFANVLALRGQVAQLETTLPPLQQRIDQAEHLLATLSGALPSQWHPLALPFAELQLPQHLPLSLPAALVHQRPDILAAEAALHSASAAVGAATAAQFPDFTLNGSYGQYSTSSRSLFAGNGNFWNLGVDVAAPLLDGGTRRELTQAARDAYAQSQAQYRQTVLEAFGQVADTLRALQHDAETLQAADAAQAAAENAWRLLQVNEQAGLANGLQVLAAQGQYLQARIASTQARALRLQDTTAYFIALGGEGPGR